jgi:hypothetical protein
MKPRFIIAALVLLIAGAFFVSRAYSDEKKMSPKEQQMMETWMKYATPGENHKLLDPLVGSWDCAVKYWMDPNSPAQESKGTCESKWILGGRYIQDELSGDMGGTPYHGMGITGYDNLKQEYIMFWIDDMGTSFMVITGKSDPTGKVFTMSGSEPDPMDLLKVKPFKSVTTIVDNDKHIYTMYVTGSDGKEYKNLEVTYTRKK